MLKGISPLLSPDLLKVMHEMGHGDELLLADAHFPGHAIGHRVIRADGLTLVEMLDAILPLLAMDKEALTMMQPDAEDILDPTLEVGVVEVLRNHSTDTSFPSRICRERFYEKARASYAIVMTGELRAYGNLILRKGLTPPFLSAKRG